MVRINFADHLFLRMHHGLGFPVFNQLVWQFDVVVSGADVRALHRALTEGLLNRQCIDPIFPLARHRWVKAVDAKPLYVEPALLDVADIAQWAGSRVGEKIDPETGYGWELSVATVGGPVAGTGTVLSLVCSHMIADGSAMVEAVCSATALIGDAENDCGTVSIARKSAVLVQKDTSLIGSVTDDLRDAAGQLESILKGAVHAASTLVREQLSLSIPRRTATTAEPAAVEPRRWSEDDDRYLVPSWRPPVVFIECASNRWRSTAETWHGTANSLFIALVAAVIQGSGRLEAGDEVQFSLPVSDRHDSDIRSNATKIVPVTLTIGHTEDRDLSPIRKASKSAFADMGLARSDQNSAMMPLVQMLPDWVARKIPTPPGSTEALCSNLGVLPRGFTTIGGVVARCVAARATFAECDARFARSMGGSIMAWAAETDSRITVTIQGMDPKYFPSAGVLKEAVAAALDRWELDAEFL